MKEYTLAGTKRAESGKKYAKQLRAEGLIPCNLISKEGPVAFSVKATDVRNLLYTSHVYAVKLSIDGAECLAVLKEAQFGPINEEIYHLDFQKFNAEDPITVAIPVKLEGFAAGQKDGGKLVKQVRSLTVKGKYTDIPERLIVDVTPIQLGKTLKVSELSYDNLEIMNPKTVIVAAVKVTRAAKK